jgi:hypothetical protein
MRSASVALWAKPHETTTMNSPASAARMSITSTAMISAWPRSRGPRPVSF